MTVGFDNLIFNKNLLMSLPFREGSGLITHDESKLNNILTQHIPGGGSFVWGNLGTGIPYLHFVPIGGGVGDGVYLDCPAADTVSMNFTSGDYSVGGWINWLDLGAGQSEILIGRYQTEVDGWDLYLNISGGRNTLSHRHHHSSLGAGNLKSECYSEGWTPGEWHFMGVSRKGTDVQHFRNRIPLVMAPTPTVMLDPDTANKNMVLGARGVTLSNNWLYAMTWNLRVWNRTFSREDWATLWNREKHWFGA